MYGSVSGTSKDLPDVYAPEWEIVETDYYSTTYRCRVPSGWLVSQKFNQKMLADGTSAPSEPRLLFLPDQPRSLGWDILGALVQITVCIGYAVFLIWVLLRLFGG